MSLIGDHHDIRAVGQYWEGIFICPRHEFLNRGEDNASARPVGQFGAQIAPRFDLHWLLTQQILGQREHAEQLAIQVVAVSDHHDGRVFHGRFLHHPRGKAGHGNALA
ncbi:hypothetical protein D3C76_1222990 [compost metagenome]